MKEIYLTQNKIAIIDDEDYEEINKNKWFYNSGYAMRKINLSKDKRTSLKMHVQILGKKEGFEIDHINGNKLDNRKENLRHCTHMQNIWNCKNSINKPKTKGVVFDKRNNTYVAKIGCNWKRYYLGAFDNEKDAALAYNKKAIELFGEYAYLNIFGEGEL